MEDDEDDSDEDEENGKKKKVSGKKDDVDVEPEMDETKMVTEKEMTPAQAKKREEIVLSMKKEMPRFKKKYGDRAKDVMYATATKMAMKEGFELGIEKSDLIEETELDEAKSGTGKILVADPKTQRVIKIDEKDWPKYEKKGWVQAESNDLDEELDRENIQMQLRKSVSLRGLKDVEFADGKKVKVPAKVAQDVMSKINSIKDAKQKQNAVQHIAKSHKHMMDFHKGDYKDADAKRQDILKLK
jgi:hypothetical protein